MTLFGIMGAAWNVFITQTAKHGQSLQPSRMASSGQQGMSPDICCTAPGPVLAAAGAAIGALARPAITTTASKVRKMGSMLIADDCRTDTVPAKAKPGSQVRDMD